MLISSMEDLVELWKKFKEDTREDMIKVKEFLSSVEETKKEKPVRNFSNETTNKISHGRREIYGKMRHLVKEIMENENISRAQDYRKAKIRLLNETSLLEA